jgi:hypothetical protein
LRFSPPPRLDSRSTSPNRPEHDARPTSARGSPSRSTSRPTSRSAERAEALDRAVLVLVQNLSPIERAAYVLREAFDDPYRQISKVLAISEANARQLTARARLHLAGERRRQVSAAQPSDSSTRSSTPPRLEISPRSKGCSPPMSSRASLARLRHSPATARPGSATSMARHIVYLLCREDRAIPSATQRFMATRAGARITSVHFSHASPVSHRPSRDPAHPARRSPSSLTTRTPARRHGVSQQFTLDPRRPRLRGSGTSRDRTTSSTAPDQDHLPEGASE